MSLFNSIDIINLFADINEKAKTRIESLTAEQIAANDLELLVNNIYEEFKIECISIFIESEKRSIKEGKIRKFYDFYRGRENGGYDFTNGLIICFEYAFKGDSIIFDISSHEYIPSRLSKEVDVSICDSSLIFKYSIPMTEINTDTIKKNIDALKNNDLAYINYILEGLNKKIELNNAELKKIIVNHLTIKKKNNNLLNEVTKIFDIPVQPSNHAKDYILPDVKKKIFPIKNILDAPKIYRVSDKNYEQILDVIKHTGITFERTPQACKSLGENSLRDLLLASLNGAFQGAANGEVFRHKGKTDICIEAEERDAFVAECKIWKGKKIIKETLQQLDSYLTWRDCKTAIIFFCRNKDFLKITSDFAKHLNELNNLFDIKAIDKDEYKCFFNSSSTSGQRKLVTFLLFNLYVE